MRTTLLATLVVTALVLTSCETEKKPSGGSDRVQPRAGATCTVFFRSDVLGQSSESPRSALINGVNGATVSHSGSFVRMDDEWFVLKEAISGDECWIPRSTILAVRVKG